MAVLADGCAAVRMRLCVRMHARRRVCACASVRMRKCVSAHVSTCVCRCVCGGGGSLYPAYPTVARGCPGRQRATRARGALASQDGSAVKFIPDFSRRIPLPLPIPAAPLVPMGLMAGALATCRSGGFRLIPPPLPFPNPSTGPSPAPPDPAPFLPPFVSHSIRSRELLGLDAPDSVRRSRSCAHTRRAHRRVVESWVHRGRGLLRWLVARNHAAGPHRARKAALRGRGLQNAVKGGGGTGRAGAVGWDRAGGEGRRASGPAGSRRRRKRAACSIA